MNRAPVVVTVVAGVLAGVAVLVLCGVSTVMGLLALAAITTIVGHEVREARAGPPAALPSAPSPAAAPDVVGELALAGWSGPELCHAWRLSYGQLQRHRDATTTERLAQARRAYLDELQRRDPAGFAAWIASGARAAGDPTRYLTGPP